MGLLLHPSRDGPICVQVLGIYVVPMPAHPRRQRVSCVHFLLAEAAPERSERRQAGPELQ
eukprot:1389367-Lingulodinium_polyedra.AAC.1